MNESSLVLDTLGRAFGSLWSMFWPVLVVLLGFLVLAFAAYVWRRFTNVG